MRKLIAIAGAVALAGAMAAPAVATQPDDDGVHKVWICHATGSETNPWVLIPPDKAAKGAHDRHQDDRDIIGPPVDEANPLPKNFLAKLNRDERQEFILELCDGPIG